MEALTDASYDPADPHTLRNPHPIFARLRREDPVHWSAPMSGWVISSYDLATEVLTDSTTYSAARLTNVRKHLPSGAQDTATEVLRWLNTWMVFRDPPDHTRLRRHMASVLNLPKFESLRQSVESTTATLLDGLPRHEGFDFASSFAMMLPGMVVMDLFGIDRSRLLEVKGWSDDMMLFIGSARGMPEKYERARRGAVAMGQLFQSEIEKRRVSPADDLLSQLMKSEIDGRAMNDDELTGSMMMVLNGGHETTANLLNNALMALIENPAAAAELRRHRDLLPGAIEEFLRYDGPILSVGRIVTQAVTLGDRVLSPGERVFAMLQAANRDDEVFETPDQLDIRRAPNPHMAFGKGPHFCLGAPLARIEGQVAIAALVDRFSSFALTEDMTEVPWINSMVTRGPTRLPVRFT